MFNLQKTSSSYHISFWRYISVRCISTVKQLLLLKWKSSIFPLCSVEIHCLAEGQWNRCLSTGEFEARPWSMFERPAHYSPWSSYCWWEYMMGIISSPQSWACWPSPWPSLWVGSQRCSERRRTQWVPRTQTRNRSRSRRLTPWWLMLEARRSGRLPSAWSWWEQSWSLWKEHRHKVQIRLLWVFSDASTTVHTSTAAQSHENAWRSH